MPPPVPRCSGWAYSSLISPGRSSLPRYGGRVGLHIDLFEACSAFTRVAACTLARSPIRDPLIEGFSHFVTSMTAPIAYGWSESPGGPCTHWKAPPFHGARRGQRLYHFRQLCRQPGQCHLRLPFPELRGKQVRLTDVMGIEVYNRDALELVDPGL